MLESLPEQAAAHREKLVARDGLSGAALERAVIDALSAEFRAEAPGTAFVKQKFRKMCDEHELPFCTGKKPYPFGLSLLSCVLHCASNESNAQMEMLWRLTRSKVGMTDGTWEKFIAALQSPRVTKSCAKRQAA